MKKNFHLYSVTAATSILLISTTAHAIAINSNVIPINLAVFSPSCTVTNSNSSIPMPAANKGQSIATYQSLNLPVIASSSPDPKFGTTGAVTSTTLRQTAIITCSTANVTITSFAVQPGPGQSNSPPGTNGDCCQNLVDTTTPTPLRLMNVFAEQLTVNGNPAVWAYSATNTARMTPYTTPFNTGVLTGSPAASTATVVWQPIFSPVSDASVFPTPTGGSFNGSFQIVVNY